MFKSLTLTKKFKSRKTEAKRRIIAFPNRFVLQPTVSLSYLAGTLGCTPFDRPRPAYPQAFPCDFPETPASWDCKRAGLCAERHRISLGQDSNRGGGSLFFAFLVCHSFPRVWPPWTAVGLDDQFLLQTAVDRFLCYFSSHFFLLFLPVSWLTAYSREKYGSLAVFLSILCATLEQHGYCR